jgi:molybdate transport system substrate-binding protein
MGRAAGLVALASLLLVPAAQAGTVHVAVAANFTAVAEELAPLFTAQTGHAVSYSFGATGLLYAQISQGAPFEVFLAADNVRPIQAVTDGFGVKDTVFTYAIGALALYSTALDLADGAAVLEEGGFEKLAIADPETAPYGRAAIETLTALGLLDALTPKFVTGENISQTLQFVETGNAELGFVAASQVVGSQVVGRPGVWQVPAALHEPIRQDAVLLKHGEANPAALAFVDFLGSEAAVAVIEAAGYFVE